MQEQSGDPANPTGHDSSQGGPEGTAPEEWICTVNISIRSLVRLGGAAEALPRQLPESFPGVILFCEVTNQNANAHYLFLELRTLSVQRW